MANQFSTEEGRKAAKLLRDKKRNKRYEALGWSAEYLQREYVDKNRSLDSLAEESRVSIHAVRSALAHFNIAKDSSLWTQKGATIGARNMRDPNSALRKANANRSEEDKAKIAVKIWETRNKNRIAELEKIGITKELLTELYITQNKSLKSLMAHFEVSKSTIRSWLDFSGIKKTQAQRDVAKTTAISELYADEERAAEMTRKTQITIRERYGNSWYRVTSSKEELAVETFLKETFPKLEISRGDYSVIHKGGHGGALQLDFYFPKLLLAIEYNGEYWHDRDAYEEDVANGTELSRERMKDRLCSEKGILLYHLWSSDWKKDSENAKLELVKLIEAAIVTTS